MAQKKSSKKFGEGPVGELPVEGRASWRKCQLGELPVGGLVPVGGQNLTLG